MFLIFFILSIVSDTPVFNIKSNPIAFDGKYTLVWNSVDGRDVIVDQSSDKSFKVFKKIYSGRDKKTFLSGLREGMYYFRLSYAGKSQYSKRLKLKVVHQPIQLAYTLFILGALVSLFIVLVIVKGHINTRRVV